MGTFIIRRILLSIVVVFLVTLLVFFMLQIVPGGDPARAMLGLEATQGEVDALRAEMWLDRPIHTQYINWISNAIQGDFGKSLRYRISISEMISKRLPITLHITTLSLFFSVVFGVSGGIICAVKRGSLLDQIVSVLANGAVAIPIFWLGILLIYIFALNLNWVPTQGYTTPSEDLWLSTKKVIMPVICMCLPTLALMTRQTRSSMLEVIRQDYIRTAWSKGLAERIVITKHALKNALIPIVTLLGICVPQLFAGSVLVESVFNIPGMGRLLVNGVLDKDFIVVQAGVLIMALVITIVNLLVDIFYGVLDPRIRYH